MLWYELEEHELEEQEQVPPSFKTMRFREANWTRNYHNFKEQLSPKFMLSHCIPDCL